MNPHCPHTMLPDEPTATEDQAHTRPGPRPDTAADSGAATASAASAARKRHKPGERRIQILQTLAAMLEQPAGERITTAALAARLEVSEAALYRHFASKAQMFEGLIEFIEQSVFTLANQIVEREPRPMAPVPAKAPSSCACCCSLPSATQAWPGSWWATPWYLRTNACRRA
jgi:acyl-CoA reductase-like NAD-dependent aldehyde dehydrogenase